MKKNKPKPERFSGECICGQSFETTETVLTCRCGRLLTIDLKKKEKTELEHTGPNKFRASGCR